jgi:hypothetical protein
METFSWDEPIESEVVLAAVQSLERILGKTITRAFIRELETKGIVFGIDRKYPLKMVREAAVSIFGEDGGYLLAYFLRKYVEEDMDLHR